MNLQTLLQQIMIPILSAAAGGWLGVQITLTELRVNMANTEDHIHTLEQIARQHSEFGERIARLEILCKEKCDACKN